MCRNIWDLGPNALQRVPVGTNGDIPGTGTSWDIPGTSGTWDSGQCPRWDRIGHRSWDIPSLVPRQFWEGETA